MDRPDTRFAWRDESALAYQTFGEGLPALLYLQGWVSNVELNWDHPAMARWLRGLSRSRQVVVMDPRGTGCSERSSPLDVWPLETIMEDIAVVLDAANVERAAIVATHELGMVACMFAATYPERTDALILYRSMANALWSEETPWEWTESDWLRQEEEVLKPWGTYAQVQSDIGDFLPSFADDRSVVDWWRRYTLLSQAPGASVAAARKYMYADVRSILGSIHVPTLVLYRPDVTVDASFEPAARFLAERIPGAQLRELPGSDSAIWAGGPEPVRAIDDFLGDVRRETSELDRVLATVLFTDIVDSTSKAAALGNSSWRDVVEHHHSSVRALLERFRGREVDTAGDGFFATFDGPARAIRCAQAIVDDVGRLGIEVRAGVHTGECETVDGKVAGLAVNIGARIGALARPSEVLVSRTVADLVVGSGLVLESVGLHELKGVPGEWELYRVD